MKAFQYAENGAPKDVLKLVEVPVPAPGADEVLVKVHAAALNPIDHMVMAGALKGAGWRMPFPFTPAYDFAGVVESVGADVKSFEKGNAVFAVNWASDAGSHLGSHGEEGVPLGGGLAQYALIPASKLSLKSEGVSFEDAAAIALVGTTAKNALDALQVGKGSKVLILGGAGAVGIVAIQLARERGAWVATTASSRNQEFVSAFKPDLLVNYNEEKWWENAVLKDIDGVFDAIGEAECFPHAKEIVREGGRFAAISNQDVGFDPTAHQPRFSWASWMCLRNAPATQDELMRLLDEGKLKIPIERTYAFTEEDVSAAFANQMGGKSKGKHVIKIE